MRIAAIDPSSTRTGFALLCYSGGKLRVEHARAITVEGERPSIERCLLMAGEVALAVHKARVSCILVEVPSGKVNAARHGGGGSGLAIYGFAAGAICHELRRAYDRRLFMFNESWTGGHSKEKRRLVAARSFVPYLMMKDGGGDIADAICLGLAAPRLAMANDRLRMALARR